VELKEGHRGYARIRATRRHPLGLPARPRMLQRRFGTVKRRWAVSDSERQRASDLQAISRPDAPCTEVCVTVVPALTLSGRGI
jgi:hypothetical protein